MLTFFLDNHIPIIFFIVATLILRIEAKKYMERKGMDRTQFISMLRQKANELGAIVISRGITAAIVTVIISMVSFRSFWINDCFHIVFIASLLQVPIETKLLSLFK